MSCVRRPAASLRVLTSRAPSRSPPSRTCACSLIRSLHVHLLLLTRLSMTLSKMLLLSGLSRSKSAVALPLDHPHHLPDGR
eukprot:3539817-Pleurochrysis_carterae.AAC.1